MRMKRGKLLTFIGILILLLVPMASAGFFSDLWGRLTGYDTEGTTSLNITIGNNPPTIEWVEVITSKTPVDDTTRSITFNFTATDPDGYLNINVSTATGDFSLAGESTRSNLSCVNWSQAVNEVNFTCNISMWYFDKADTDWEINVSIKDINDVYSENSSTTFQYSALLGMKMAPTSLGWPEVGIATINTESDDNITINNTGNDEPVSINITALNLQGELIQDEYIYANNFTVDNVTDGCSGTAMANATSTNVTSAILWRGNHSVNYNNETSGQEQITFCLKGVPQDISPQSYSSAVLGAWTITVSIT